MKQAKYPDEVREQVLALVASGLTALQAARQVGVPVSTAYFWVNRANEDDEDFQAARAVERQKMVEKTWSAASKGVDAIEKQMTDVQLEREQLQFVLRKIVADGRLDEETRAAVCDIVQNYTGVGLRDLTSATKTMYELNRDLKQAQDSSGQTVMVEFEDAEEYAG